MICNTDIICVKSEIVRHEHSPKKHNTGFAKHSNKSLKKKLNVQILEFVLFWQSIHCEHLFVNFLCLLKCLLSGVEALKKVHLGKQLASNIIRQVSSQAPSKKLRDTLRQGVFSVETDETSDRSSTNQLSVAYYESQQLVCSLMQFFFCLF